MGLALFEQGKLDEALEAFNKALAIKPDYSDVYNNQGIILQRQDKLDQALESYKKALLLSLIMLKHITIWDLLYSSKLS